MHEMLQIMSFMYNLPDFEKQTSLPLTYMCIYKCLFVELYLNIIIHWWGRGGGVSKRYLMDITYGMGSKTYQNMIPILKNIP